MIGLTGAIDMIGMTGVICSRSGTLNLWKGCKFWIWKCYLQGSFHVAVTGVRMPRLGSFSFEAPFLKEVSQKSFVSQALEFQSIRISN